MLAGKRGLKWVSAGRWHLCAVIFGATEDYGNYPEVINAVIDFASPN